MKYLKETLAVFVVTLLFSAVNVNAKVVNLSGIKIPIFSGNYRSSQENKDYQGSNQYIKKTRCVDNFSGDGRVIDAGVRGVLTGMHNSGWVEAKPNVNVKFDDNSQGIGLWQLFLASRKSLPTTATFDGVWTVN